MTSRSPFTFHHITAARHRSMSDRSQTFRPERYSDLVRRPEGFISVPRKLPSITKENDHGGSHKPTKLLLKVNIERSLGPVHVFMSPEKTVGDLVKTAVEIYVKEKRRPLLKETDPDCFELHYSQFSLESLKQDQKLINLGSRNFFLCSKPLSSLHSSCKEEPKLAINSLFPLAKLMDLLL